MEIICSKTFVIRCFIITWIIKIQGSWISSFLYNRRRFFIAACARNERWAQKLYDYHYSPMMGLLFDMPILKKMLWIWHEGFIKVFRHITKYQPGTSLTAGIRRIMVNTSIDYYRRWNRRRTQNRLIKHFL